ncbi:MFS general substrate transporter [Panus rudis PR-1116 ss-1]|nr:MFS general substrate transporter [Panus rudis PR-1116 ss-1]
MAPYFLRNLVPRREKRAEGRPLLQVLRSLTWVQWGHFFSGWLAWTCDAIDFFSVSLSVTHLTVQFDKKTKDITTAITLTLLLRSVGAVIFGVLSDRFGRKWPLVANLLVVALLELGSGFVNTFSAFLAVRSLFGIAMGGIWGLAASTGLENLPVEARGLASGILQQGYAVGYLLAAVINLNLVPSVSAGWRALFWTGAGISLFAAFIRMLLPESEVFLRAKALEKARGKTTKHKTKVFMHETWVMLKRHWLLCIYAVLLMTGFNFLSHGSQDLYPTYLQQSKGFSDHNATVATIIGNCVSSSHSGGAIAGWLSQYIGRRLTIIIFVLAIGAFIPLWILPSSFGALAAGAFCIQFGVQGAWGVIPIQLAEMSPPAFRATFPGVAYQVGNMVSSASAQIEATGGDNLKTTIPGKPGLVPDYATVQGILIGVVAAFVIIVTIIGPENHGSHFEKAKTAFEEGAGRDELEEDDLPVGGHMAQEGRASISAPTSVQEVNEKRSTESV